MAMTVFYLLYTVGTEYAAVHLLRISRVHAS